MVRAQLSNLDIVENKDGIWLYLSNMFYPLHAIEDTPERRGRKSIPLANARRITSLQDSGSLWVDPSLATGTSVDSPRFVMGHMHTKALKY